jgi:peptidoglycan/xylan/chitin deacetylase (PgdA/CDA1 family)
MQLPDHGALIVSLDFELYWGVTDLYAPSGPYDANVLGVYQVVPGLLALFQEFGVSATWATVGMVFANSTMDAERYSPLRHPGYTRPSLAGRLRGPSRGEHEKFYFAPQLVRAIAECPGQEIGTHTFSHYYCLEEGQTIEEFEADLVAAIRISNQSGVRVQSIAFPRNQINPSYLEVLGKHGITAYRGSDFGWMNSPGSSSAQRAWAKRASRLADAYVAISGDNTFSWGDVSRPDGLCNVRGSRYLRPHLPGSRLLERKRLNRIIAGIECAARSGRLFHLWFHPEDFGRHIEENLRNMRLILEAFERNRRAYGLQSLSMCQVAETVREASVAGPRVCLAV